MVPYRKAIALDFDGVLHSYTSGWHGVDVVADEPVPGSIGWLIGICLYSAWDVIITSTRCNERAGIEAMKNYLEGHIRHHMEVSSKYARMDDGAEVLEDDFASAIAAIEYTAEKPTRAFIFIDDRGWKFNGTFPSLLELEHFKPWYK